MKHILNIINSLLAYIPENGIQDNPNKRSFDWTRRLFSIEVTNPQNDSRIIPPKTSMAIYDGSKNNPLDGTSVLKLSLLDIDTSTYRLRVTAGTSGFKTSRPISSVTTCSVTVNNNSVAVFDFASASLSSVQIGDTMRIKGSLLFDQAPYAFNPLNAGKWTVIAKSGSKITVRRDVNEIFSAVNESVTDASNDVEFYANDGIQVGDKMKISGTLSEVSFKTVRISEVTPTTIDFVCAEVLPEEEDLAYISGSIAFYTNSKKFTYIEVDQPCAVRFDDETSNNTKVEPILSGDPSLVGFISKWGESYKCVIVNDSVNPLNVRIFTGE